ncbi:MAG: hypothetical protein WCA15_15675 [Candidatus Acidiferrales bacterium]
MGLLITGCFTGITLGLLSARHAATSGSGDAAEYIYLYVFWRAIGLWGLAVLPLIYWRTRWFGCGLVAAALLSVVSFGVAMRILRFEDQVPWMRPRQTAAVKTDGFAAVIYFRKDVTWQEVEEFRTSVLMEDAMPRHQGRDFPTFVTNYSRVITNLSGGRQTVAIGFADEPLTNAEKSYLTRIGTDRRVQTVELPPFPYPGPIRSEPIQP